MSFIQQLKKSKLDDFIEPLCEYTKTIKHLSILKLYGIEMHEKNNMEGKLYLQNFHVFWFVLFSGLFVERIFVLQDTDWFVAFVLTDGGLHDYTICDSGSQSSCMVKIKKYS